MKCRLKSSSAPRGVCPSPLAPVRTFDPIKASQMSPTIPILGRSRAAGLRGWFSRKFSTSSFIAAGSSSIASEVTSIETCVARIVDLKSRKNPSEQSSDQPRSPFSVGRLCQTPQAAKKTIYSRPQIMATEVVRLPPMLNVRNFFTFSICRAPACCVSC